MSLLLLIQRFYSLFLFCFFNIYWIIFLLVWIERGAHTGAWLMRTFKQKKKSANLLLAWKTKTVKKCFHNEKSKQFNGCKTIKSHQTESENCLLKKKSCNGKNREKKFYFFPLFEVSGIIIIIVQFGKIFWVCVLGVWKTQ
jgi:hypothetical protein